MFLRAGQMAELDARRIEVLANAARLIQRQIRTHLARKEFIILRQASIRMQKLWRGSLLSSMTISCACKNLPADMALYVPITSCSKTCTKTI